MIKIVIAIMMITRKKRNKNYNDDDGQVSVFSLISSSPSLRASQINYETV